MEAPALGSSRSWRLLLRVEGGLSRRGSGPSGGRPAVASCLSCSWIPLGWYGGLMWVRWGLVWAWASPRAFGLMFVSGPSMASCTDASNRWAEPGTFHWVSDLTPTALRLASVVSGPRMSPQSIRLDGTWGNAWTSLC